MRKHNILKSRIKEVKKKRRRLYAKKILIVFFSFLVLIGTLAYLSRLDRIQIKDIILEGNNAISKDEINSLIDDKLSGNYFIFFPKKNILIYPKDKIHDHILDQIKRISSLEINLDSQKNLLISVNERKPEYLWCGIQSEEEIVNKDLECYFMDRESYIFSKAPFFSGSIYFRFLSNIIDDGSTLLTTGHEYLGTNLLDREKFYNLVNLKDNLPELGINPKFAYLKDDQETEIYFDNLTLNPSPEGGRGSFHSKIIFNTDDDIDLLYSNLAAALTTDPLATQFKNNPENLLYIDLRYDNKVYYKFQNQ